MEHVELCVLCDFSLFLLFPEKALVEHAIELRAELENAVSDVSNLFSKIGWYCSLVVYFVGYQLKGNHGSDVRSIFVHELFFKTLERKDKIEEGNRILIQKFQSQLAKQLEDLHMTVAASAMQQEQQLKEMEEDMYSFVSTKAEVGFHRRQLCSSLILSD